MNAFKRFCAIHQGHGEKTTTGPSIQTVNTRLLMVYSDEDAKDWLVNRLLVKGIQSYHLLLHQTFFPFSIDSILGRKEPRHQESPPTPTYSPVHSVSSFDFSYLHQINHPVPYSSVYDQATYHRLLQAQATFLANISPASISSLTAFPSIVPLNSTKHFQPIGI